ncbi:MAG: hypothetical protein J6R77_06600 [Clostridia bacterium]|nr:hypothetical protein [Clostridia bacterium]
MCRFKWILCLCFLAILCCSCNKSYSEFDTELTGILSKQYGISIPDSAKLIEAEYRWVAERDPHLTVVFDISGGDIRDVFDKQMWSESDIISALSASVGEDTTVEWVHEVNEGTYYYYANMHLEKISTTLYRVHFCGFGVDTQYFEE